MATDPEPECDRGRWCPTISVDDPDADKFEPSSDSELEPEREPMLDPDSELACG